MAIQKSFIFIFYLLSFFGQSQNQINNDQMFTYSGRVENLNDNKVILISSASSVSFNFSGSSCSISLQNIDTWQHHNYVSLVLDGEYIGRLKIEKDGLKSYDIPIRSTNQEHNLTIYKATEAANGGVLFAGTNAKLLPIIKKNKKKIEFIGDSITCGMGNDTKEIPCGNNSEWFDQHNAYWAYGPILSRKLDVEYQLSSVSGIGMYRNWNDEHILEAIMPDVYENLYLNKDKSKPYLYNFHPDIISICLGTNDFSDGDGVKKRLPFDEKKFISNYTHFIKQIYRHHPNTQLVLLNSPMVSGDRNLKFVDCLKKITKNFKNKKIEVFEFKPMTPKGCGYHPDIDDHSIMAEQLESFFKKLIDEK